MGQFVFRQCDADLDTSLSQQTHCQHRCGKWGWGLGVGSGMGRHQYISTKWLTLLPEHSNSNPVVIHYITTFGRELVLCDSLYI